MVKIFWFCLNTLWTTLHGSKLYEMLLEMFHATLQISLNILAVTLPRSKPYAILSEKLQTTLHQKNLVQHSWNNIVQIKTLFNVLGDPPSNIPQEKIMCLFVLTLLRQYCTGKNQLQCCPRGSRQFSPSENPAQFFFITLGTLINSSKPYTLLPKRL